VEISIDNGNTWKPSPKDPITLITEPIPPVISGISANKCDAATNGKQHFSDWVAHVSDAFDVAVGFLEFAILVAAAIINILLLYLTGGALTAGEGLFIEIIGNIMAAVWEAGKTAFVEYWTSDNVDIVMCAMYCNISDDGSFTDTGYAGMVGDLRAKLPSSPAKELAIGMFQSIGRQGLNKWVSYGNAAESDCSDCECQACDDDWAIWHDDGQHGVNLVFGDDTNGHYVQLTATQASNNNYYAIVTRPTGDDCCVWLTYDFVGGTPAGEGAFGTRCGGTDGDFQTKGTLPFGGAVWQAQVQATEPFTVRFRFA
jgi:hypothetical protein